MHQPKEWGRVVESSIGAHLLNHSITGDFTLHYWREGNDEVDFILERKGKLIAIEVKTGQESSTKGISVFQKKYNPDKVLLIGDSGFPWQEFLMINPATLFNN